MEEKIRVIKYALLETVVADLFVACVEHKIIYSSFVDQDHVLGNGGSFCIVNGKMSIGIAGLREFLLKNKLFVYELEPDYDSVKKIVDAIAEANDTPYSHFWFYGTKFQQQVWFAVVKVRVGETVTYGQLAEMVGCSNGRRAVANALAANNIAMLVPCHRVIRADGDPGGYRWGMALKKQMLDFELNGEKKSP